jgi:hypothetical protein
MEKLKNNLVNVNYISMTTDCWTASTSNLQFISLTAHWITKNYEQQMTILRVVPFPGSHTGDAISNVILKTQ